MKDFEVEDLGKEENRVERRQLSEKEIHARYKKLKKKKPNKKKYKNEKATSIVELMERPRIQKIKKILFVILWIMLAAELALGVTFLVKLGNMNLLPTRYFVIGAVIYGLINVLLIIWNLKKKILSLEFLVVLALIIALLYPNHILFTLDSALHKMSDNSSYEIKQFSVVVLADDPAESLEDLGGYTIAYATNAVNVEEAQMKLETTVPEQIYFSAYVDQISLAKELLEKRVNCIMIGTEYLDVINDIEGLDVFKTGTKVIGTIDTQKAIDQSQKNNEEKDVYVFYISGIDTYGQISVTSRSDVNILAFVNMKTGKCQLISTPRDSYVECPLNGYAHDKLTNCGLYGIQCSEDTLEYLYGGEFEIDYYMRVNFSGFINIIDELGGVDVYSDRSFTSVDGYHYSKGDLHLNGTEALHFARERKAFAAGVIARDNHQMDVIKAVIEKMTSSTKMLTNFGNILDAVSESFQTDMPVDKMYELVNYQLDNGLEWEVSTFSMNGEGTRSTECYSQKTHNTYVMMLDSDMLEYAKALIEGNKYGYAVGEYTGRTY